jgi:hypothetical protein
MCGIFGFINLEKPHRKVLRSLASHSEQRGKDSSGFLFYDGKKYSVTKADVPVTELLKSVEQRVSKYCFGHSRLITNGTPDNQPVVTDSVVVFHNGIIVNEGELWDAIGRNAKLEIDTEVIAQIVDFELTGLSEWVDICQRLLREVKGVMSCALVVPSQGKLILVSNNGSLFYANSECGGIIYASEKYVLEQLGCTRITQVHNDFKIFEIVASDEKVAEKVTSTRNTEYVPDLVFESNNAALLQYFDHKLQRCSKCILPSTMPFIEFDQSGVCNYCTNYTKRNGPKSFDELSRLADSYRRSSGAECIVPFSGGRDSTYSLHLIVKELGLRPLTYTYDWGMVTDVGRRNISRICSELKVENLIVAADIGKKRENIRKNVIAWLKSPHLGMISLFTAGDKHFFRYLEDLKKQTGISLNIWGANPLEITHFKAGFLGVAPGFKNTRVYNNGIMSQLSYQSKRLAVMAKTPAYFNNSLWDTFSGEWYRSVMAKSDYYEVFDYQQWVEEDNNRVLDMYGWERALDTSSTWRIGDGTAAFYNYIYRTVAGFSEHETFRSNQIREGQLSRERALELVREECMPRYANIKWYLDAIQLDFSETIKTINEIPKLYEPLGENLL